MIRPDAPNGGITRSATAVTTSCEVTASARAEARSWIRAARSVPAASASGSVSGSPLLPRDRAVSQITPTRRYGRPPASASARPRDRTHSVVPWRQILNSWSNDPLVYTARRVSSATQG